MSGTFRTSKRGRIYEDKDRRNTKAARSCLHGGDCPYCQGNRQHTSKRQQPIEQLEEDIEYQFNENDKYTDQ